MKPQRIGIWGNTAKEAVPPMAGRLLEWLELRGCRVVMARPLADLIGGRAEAVPEEDLGASVDLLVSLGGDGSLLYCARLVGGSEVPILGVNLGRLGFLAEASPESMLEALGAVLDGDFKIEERMNLDAILGRGGEEVARFRALNDVVVDRGASPRVLEFEIRVEGVQVTDYTGDGVILATPTGSTAHSLSANGPVVNPAIRAVIITPMCAHSLAARTVIVSDRERVDVEICSSGADARLAVDGQIGLAVRSGDCLTVKGASEVTRLVRLNDTSFYEILRTKFRWGSPRLNDED